MTLRTAMKTQAWHWSELEPLLIDLALKARDEQACPIVAPERLLSIVQENRVRLLLQHGVPFSLECKSCDDCASGDGVNSIEQAVGEGWTEIEPAPPDSHSSHFWGLCPDHREAQ